MSVYLSVCLSACLPVCLSLRLARPVIENLRQASSGFFLGRSAQVSSFCGAKQSLVTGRGWLRKHKLSNCQIMRFGRMFRLVGGAVLGVGGSFACAGAYIAVASNARSVVRTQLNSSRIKLR